VWTVVARRIAPAQTIADDKHDPADHPPVIHSRHSVRQRKIWRILPHLRLRKPKQIILALAALVRGADPFFVQALRLIAFDSYQRLAPQPYDPDLPVRIVDIAAHRAQRSSDHV
jgi:hypothetical protein